MYNNYLGGAGQGQGQGQGQSQGQGQGQGHGNTPSNPNAHLLAMLAQQLGGGVAPGTSQQQQQPPTQPSDPNAAAIALLQQQLALFQQIQSATQALVGAQGLQQLQQLQQPQQHGQPQLNNTMGLLLAAAQQQQQHQHQHQHQQPHFQQNSTSASSTNSPAAQVAALAQWSSGAPPAPTSSTSSISSSNSKKPHTATWDPSATHKSTAAAPAYGAMAYPARDTLSQRQKRELAARHQEAQFRLASAGSAAEERDKEYHQGNAQPHEGGGNRERDRDRFVRGDPSDGHPPAPWKQQQKQPPARNFSPPPVGGAASPVRQTAPPAPAANSGAGWAALKTFNAPPAPAAQSTSQGFAGMSGNKFGLPLPPSQRAQQQQQQQQVQQKQQPYQQPHHHQQQQQQQQQQKPASALFAMFGGGASANASASPSPDSTASNSPQLAGHAHDHEQAYEGDHRAVRGYKDLYGPNAGIGGGRAKPTFSCEPCGKTFPSSSQLRSHLDTHVQCSQCEYQAGQRAVKFHEMEHHGMHQEEPDQGEILLPAHIKLDTPEDIAKWIADRKRRYPTDANVAAKKAEHQARAARGELPLASSSSATAAAASNAGPLCRFIRNNQPCPHGTQCKYRHDAAPGEAEADNAPGMYAGRGNKRAPLLERLLEREMRLEHSHLLQCLRFMVNNRFFDYGIVWTSGLEDGPGAKAWGMKPGEAAALDGAVAAKEPEDGKGVDEVDEMVFGTGAVDNGALGAASATGANVPDLDTLRRQLLAAEHDDAMLYSDDDAEERHGGNEHSKEHVVDVDAAEDPAGADESSMDILTSATLMASDMDANVYADGEDDYDRTPTVFLDEEAQERKWEGGIGGGEVEDQEDDDGPEVQEIYKH